MNCIAFFEMDYIASLLLLTWIVLLHDCHRHKLYCFTAGLYMNCIVSLLSLTLVGLFHDCH